MINSAIFKRPKMSHGKMQKNGHATQSNLRENCEREDNRIQHRRFVNRRRWPQDDDRTSGRRPDAGATVALRREDAGWRKTSIPLQHRYKRDNSLATKSRCIRLNYTGILHFVLNFWIGAFYDLNGAFRMVIKKRMVSRTWSRKKIIISQIQNRIIRSRKWQHYITKQQLK